MLRLSLRVSRPRGHTNPVNYNYFTKSEKRKMPPAKADTLRCIALAGPIQRNGRPIVRMRTLYEASHRDIRHGSLYH